MGQIIRKVRDEQVDCILIGPAWSRHWVAMLHTVTVRHKMLIPSMPNLFIPGPHAGTKASRGQQAFAWFILCG